MTCDALLVGSVPLADAEAVFRAVAGTLGGHLSCVPDGETGPRRYWIHCQDRVLEANPYFQPMPRDVDSRDRRGDGSVPPPRYRLRPDAVIEDVAIGPLGYAQWAIDSFRTLRRLKAEGAVPQSWKLQVNLPTPHAFVQHMLMFANQAAVEPLYEARMMKELDQIVSEIPAR